MEVLLLTYFCGLIARQPGILFLPMSEVHHETVFFSGHVQGVGFRYSVSQVAKEFEVAGSVENLTDGRVKLDVEGEPAEVEGLVAAIGERMHGFIRKTERHPDRRERKFTQFSIR